MFPIISIKVSIWRVIRENSKEWWIITLGVLAAAINGLVFPSFPLFFGEILKIFQLPADEVLGETHMWAALFIVLGIVLGICNVIKVLSFLFVTYLYQLPLTLQNN